MGDDEILVAVVPRAGESLDPAGLIDLAGLHVGDARLSRDREAGGHPVGAENPRHLGDVRALAAEQVAHLLGAVGEVVDPAVF